MSRPTLSLRLLVAAVTFVVRATQQVISMGGNSSLPQSDWIWNQLHCWEGVSEPRQIGKIKSVWHIEGQTAYKVQGEGVGTIFKVNPETGDIGVYRVLDREKKDQYRLEGSVINKNTLKQIGTSTNFTIRILDVNDNAPIFTKDPFNGTVAEMSSKGTSVLTISAHDPDDPTVDKHAKVTYKILSTQDNFYIDSMSGTIYVKNTNLDRERKKDYQLIVQAKDMGLDQGGMSSSATVHISLTDINDNAPFFRHRQYNYTASEATPIGAVLGRVKAEDLDEGMNARILYTVIPDDIFQISHD